MGKRPEFLYDRRMERADKQQIADEVNRFLKTYTREGRVAILNDPKVPLSIFEALISLDLKRGPI